MITTPSPLRCLAGMFPPFEGGEGGQLRNRLPGCSESVLLPQSVFVTDENCVQWFLCYCESGN